MIHRGSGGGESLTLKNGVVQGGFHGSSAFMRVLWRMKSKEDKTSVLSIQFI